MFSTQPKPTTVHKTNYCTSSVRILLLNSSFFSWVLRCRHISSSAWVALPDSPAANCQLRVLPWKSMVERWSPRFFLGGLPIFHEFQNASFRECNPGLTQGCVSPSNSSNNQVRNITLDDSPFLWLVNKRFNLNLYLVTHQQGDVHHQSQKKICLWWNSPKQIWMSYTIMFKPESGLLKLSFRFYEVLHFQKIDFFSDHFPFVVGEPSQRLWPFDMLVLCVTCYVLSWRFHEVVLLRRQQCLFNCSPSKGTSCWTNPGSPRTRPKK